LEITQGLSFGKAVEQIPSCTLTSHLIYFDKVIRWEVFKYSGAAEPQFRCGVSHNNTLFQINYIKSGNKMELTQVYDLVEIY
jgi:hypothetical protein